MPAVSQLLSLVGKSISDDSYCLDENFRRERCILCAKLLLGVTAFFYLIACGAYLIASGGDLGAWFSHRMAVGFAFFPVIQLAFWGLSSLPGMVGPKLDAVEGFTFFGIMVAGVFNARGMDAVNPDSSALILMLTILIFRAVLIPTCGLRTMIVSIMCSFPVIWSILNPLPSDLSLQVPEEQRLFARAIAFSWIAAAVVISVMTSLVIYGLRRTAAKALEFGQYRLVEKIGAGGMGEVYRASHTMLRRPTALKLLPPDKTSAEALGRFESEVQLTAELTHPNTIAIYDYGRTPEGVFYYAMEYLDGLNLQELVDRFGPQSPARVMYIMRQVCASLSEAHRRQLIHRDVKPANIFLCRRGGEFDVVKVLDFGLVKDIGNQGRDTQSEGVLGTPHYMAPETIRDQVDVGPAVDIYAVGGVAYFLLTGTPVFKTTSAVEAVNHHLDTTPEAPSLRAGLNLPSGYDELILSCLEKDPELRPQSADELRDRFEAACDHCTWGREHARSWWEKNGEEALKREDNAMLDSEVFLSLDSQNNLATLALTGERLAEFNSQSGD